MRKLPKRKGVSLGTLLMLSMTGLLIAACGWLFPRLLGDVDFQFDATQLAVAFTTPVPASSGALLLSDTLADTAGDPLLFSPAPASQPAATPPPSRLSLRLTAAGSVQLDNAIQKAMTTDAGYQFTDLFSPLQGEVNADLAIVTLANTAISTEKLTDINVPTDVLSALRSVGFSAVHTGFPGILSSGLRGLSATQEAIRAEGMTAYGAFASMAQRGSVSLFNANGISVALLSYQSELTNASKRSTTTEEQAFAIALPTLPEITADITDARAAGAQVVVVSLHWGKKGSTSPTQDQRELAQGIANAGADVILGTGSGVVQPIELLTASRAGGQASQTLCAYSLGNLFTNDRSKRVNISGVLLHANITLDPATNQTSFDAISYTPTYVWRGKIDNRTTYAVFPSDLPPPDYMQTEQIKVMARSLELIAAVMNEPNVPRRTPGGDFAVAQ